MKISLSIDLLADARFPANDSDGLEGESTTITIYFSTHRKYG
jgi:hypothetical protein